MKVLLKVLLRIIYWVICPYIVVGILVGKTVRNKFDNDLIGVFSGLFAGLVVFCIWMAIFGPSENNTEIKKDEVKVLEAKTPKKTTLADKAYEDLNKKVFTISLSEAIEILENLNNRETLTQAKIEKHDNLKKSWVRWSHTFGLKDKSKIKIYCKKEGDKFTFTEVEVVK